MYEALSGETSLAFVGDCLLTRPLAVFREREFLGIRDLLHAADARFANLEASVHTYLDAPHAQRPGRDCTRSSSAIAGRVRSAGGRSWPAARRPSGSLGVSRSCRDATAHMSPTAMA
jgi:hypothetical protein